MQLQCDWEQSAGDFDRTFRLKADDGEVLEEFGSHPTLDQLRQAERKHGERINLTEVGVPCVNCDSEIRGRFGSDPRGNLLCWDCAVTTEENVEAGIRVNTDATEATLSESSLNQKGLCDYVINVATGCRHGCKFCYVPTTPGYEKREEMLQERADVDDIQREWGSYLLYRDDLPERLHEVLEDRDTDNWEVSERGRGIVMLSSGTDPYQDRRAAQITRGAIAELISRNLPVRILTRSSIIVKDVDILCDAGDLVTVGSSIPSFDQDLVKAIEPGAPPPLTRWEALDMLRREGISVYVSMSPTYPTLDEHGLFRLLTRFKALQPEVVFHEPINPRGENFELLVETLDQEGFSDAAARFRELRDPENWVEYALQQINWVQKKTRELNGPPIHSWPDRLLIQATSGELSDQLKEMRQAIPPEQIGRDEILQEQSQAPLFDEFKEIRKSVHPQNVNF